MKRYGRKKSTGYRINWKQFFNFLIIVALIITLSGLVADKLHYSLSADRATLYIPNKNNIWENFLRLASEIVFGVDIRQPQLIVKEHFQSTESIWVPLEDDIIFGDIEELPEEIQIKVDQIISNPARKPVKVDNKKDIRILIYHTHNDEAFAKQEGMVYKEATQGRTYDNNYNVVRVGKELADSLQALGYTVVHDTTDHVSKGFYTAYNRSLETIEKNLKSGKFDLVIDLHRDAYYGSAKVFNTVEVDGKASARMMFVIGTGEGDENTTYKVKPDWQTNLAMAQNITNELNAMGKDLCKKVNVKKGRYNQHLSAPSVLIEVGNDHNTLGEAQHAAVLLARAIDKVFSSNT